jgi:hypothetical protein
MGAIGAWKPLTARLGLAAIYTTSLFARNCGYPRAGRTGLGGESACTRADGLVRRHGRASTIVSRLEIRYASIDIVSSFVDERTSREFRTAALSQF